MSTIACRIVCTEDASQPPAHQNHVAKPKTQVKSGGAEEDLRRGDSDAARAAQRIQAEEYQRHQNPIQIEQARARANSVRVRD